MPYNPQSPEAATAGAFAWTGRVLTADELPTALNGQRELLVSEKVIVTPLAADELKRRGIRLVRKQVQATTNAAGSWAVAQESVDPVVASVIQALRRDGLALEELDLSSQVEPGQWARSVAEFVARRACMRVIAFCVDAGLCCCIANKIAGLRAVAVASAQQVARAMHALGANLLAVESGGRTFHEVRQIIRAAGVNHPGGCPPYLATTLRELDGHAHR